MLTGSNDAAIARIIVAEGVETNDRHAFLAATNRNAFQGFLFSQPPTERQFRSPAARAAASGAG